MSEVMLPITPPTLPAGYCWPDNPQDFVNLAVGGAVVRFDTTGATLVLVQNSQPLNTQRDRLWFNTDTSHLLFYNQTVASWTAWHPAQAGGLVRQIYLGDAASLDTYDGGSAGVVGAVTGPMWMIDPLFAGRFPLGAGNLPDVVNGIVTILLNGTGGHNELPVIRANLPTDTVAVKTSVIGQAGVVGTGAEPVVGNTYGSDPVSGTGGACDATASGLAGRYYTRGITDPLGSGTALNSIGPYFGVNIIKRTARQFYVT